MPNQFANMDRINYDLKKIIKNYRMEIHPNVSSLLSSALYYKLRDIITKAIIHSRTKLSYNIFDQATGKGVIIKQVFNLFPITNNIKYDKMIDPLFVEKKLPSNSIIDKLTKIHRELKIKESKDCIARYKENLEKKAKRSKRHKDKVK